MKILLLNPHLYEAPILTTLRKLGAAVIVCADLKECELVHKFHASSVTLFVGHDDDGVKMNEFLKTNPRFARTPVILTTSRWTEQQCIDHQATPFAANAYLRMPVEDKDFIHVIDAVLGTELSHGKGFNISDDLSAIAPIQAPDLPLFTSGSDASSSAAPFIPTTDGVTLIGLNLNEGIQIEDGASVYGKATPGLEGNGEVFPGSPICLDEPSFDLGAAPESTSGTMEILTARPEEFPSPVATPIEAVSLDVPADEQATRVAFMPVFTTPPESEELDSEALEAMPYLEQKTKIATQNYVNPLGYREPMDDAVVPGGAATVPDVETLKKYLYLREQDVTALSAQLRQAREQIGKLENQLKHEKVISTEFSYLAQEQDRRIDGFDKEKFVALESAQKELDDVKFEMKRRSEKIRVMELQVKEATDATERLKERVRGDIRKIRSREKELENRLEIMKKDSEALLGSREQKIIELKRKLDLTEFNTDLLQDQLEKERRMSGLLREKLAKAAQIVRVAGGLLSPEEEALISNRETTGATRTSVA